MLNLFMMKNKRIDGMIFFITFLLCPNFDDAPEADDAPDEPLSFRVQISGYPITKKALKRGLFCYGSEGEIRTLDTWIMIPPL